GALGVAVAYATSEYLRTPVLWLYIGRKGPLTAGDMVRAAGPFVLGAHVALAILWLVRPHLPDQTIVALAGAAILSYAVTVAVALVFPFGRRSLREALDLLPKRRSGQS
ncbi:MAG TPA: lipopolysaccharide biosynthesis protein, partial [Sinorhizobium sp.]|nr:lipopolysaccharide biosynthesis protein [Sinorhizobium sp.]